MEQDRMNKARHKYTNTLIQFAYEIDMIDKETPWQETEPDWWHEMMQLRKLIQSNLEEADPIKIRDT